MGHHLGNPVARPFQGSQHRRETPDRRAPLRGCPSHLLDQQFGRCVVTLYQHLLHHRPDRRRADGSQGHHPGSVRCPPRIGTASDHYPAGLQQVVEKAGCVRRRVVGRYAQRGRSVDGIPEHEAVVHAESAQGTRLNRPARLEPVGPGPQVTDGVVARLVTDYTSGYLPDAGVHQSACQVVQVCVGTGILISIGIVGCHQERVPATDQPHVAVHHAVQRGQLGKHRCRQHGIRAKVAEGRHTCKELLCTSWGHGKAWVHGEQRPSVFGHLHTRRRRK